MNRWMIRVAVLATVAFAASLALAQGGAQRGPGGMFQNEAVKRELKLTAAQGKKLEALNARGPGGRPAQGQGQRDPKARAKAAAERDAKIKGILNATQYKRYHELRLRQQGLSALGDPSTAAKLGLSKAQQDKIRAIQTKAMETMRTQFQGGGQPDREKMRGAFEKMRKDTDAKILATLTAAQKVKWTALLGKPFKFG